MKRPLRDKSMASFARIVRPGEQGCAPIDVLARRTYIRAIVRLRKGRVLIVGRLPL